MSARLGQIIKSVRVLFPSSISCSSAECANLTSSMPSLRYCLQQHQTPLLSTLRQRIGGHCPRTPQTPHFCREEEDKGTMLFSPWDCTAIDLITGITGVSQDIQFFREASEAAFDETGNRKRRRQMHDEDEIEQEQEERRHRARLNKEFKAFADKIAENVSFVLLSAIFCVLGPDFLGSSPMDKWRWISPSGNLVSTECLIEQMSTSNLRWTHLSIFRIYRSSSSLWVKSRLPIWRECRYAMLLA
jgi:hypothetical protein